MTSKVCGGFRREWGLRAFAVLVAALGVQGCNSGSAAQTEFVSVCQQECDMESTCRAQVGQTITVDVAHCKDVCMTASGAAKDCPNVAGLIAHSKGCLALDCSGFLSCIDESTPCDLVVDSGQPSHD